MRNHVNVFLLFYCQTFSGQLFVWEMLEQEERDAFVDDIALTNFS